ncbi:MAG TPA: dynamin family protein [Acidimicrobiales bacterium]|nr:dynamin family protein [Acidimicrobiales bacterium]
MGTASGEGGTVGAPTAPQQGRPHLDAATQVVDLALTACGAYGRDDLARRVEDRRRRLLDPGVAVVVIGEFKQGKSTLVNALLGTSVCPVDDDIATAVPTTVRFGETVQAVALSADGPSPLAPEEVPALVTGRAGSTPVTSVEVTVPRRLLASGLRLVDTPGVGGLAGEHAAAALGSLAVAHAAVFVTDASQELTQSELAALRRAADRCAHVCVALTKTDLQPRRHRVAELDRGHLAAAGLDLPLFPLSAVVRQQAIERSDPALNEESGYPALIGWLRDDVLARSDAAEVAAAAHDVAGVCDQLAVEFDAERRALADPAAIAALVAELERARARAAQLESSGARWQTALNDGVTDLTSDVDHDLRARFRHILAEADTRIEAADPVDIWEEFDPWLRRVVADEVAANHAVLVDQAAALSARIAALFAEEADAALDLLGDGPLPSLEGIRIDLELDVTRTNLVNTALGVLRGGYGGMLMFGMLASMVGITLIAPVSVAIGLAMGRKQQREEQQRQLAQRRQTAKQTYRKYVDEVSFAVGKESRDALRRVQRDLRDSWADRAKQLQRSTNEALRAAQEAERTASDQRGRRLADVEAELARIAALRARALDLVGGPEAGASSA